jgi:hypothetical protein
MPQAAARGILSYIGKSGLNIRQTDSWDHQDFAAYHPEKHAEFAHLLCLDVAGFLAVGCARLPQGSQVGRKLAGP